MSTAKIPTTPLGDSGPAVPVLGLGLMGLSKGPYGPIPGDEERLAFLDRAFELGYTFWDSADLYGDSEELIGKWFKRTGKRDQIFVATKFGFVKGSKTLEVDSSGAYCKKACDECLKNLGIDSIDLCMLYLVATQTGNSMSTYIYPTVYMHHANHKTPIEETMRALVELKAEGKIKHIGLSGINAATLRRAVKIAPIAAVQTDYSPFNLEIEQAHSGHLLKACRELQIPVVAAMPLARGMLTNRFASGDALTEGEDMRNKLIPRFHDGNREKNIEISKKYQALADKKGCSVAQLSLAWLRKQGGDIIPIPGTKQIKYLEDNWASLNVELTAEEEAEVRQLSETTELAGYHLPPAFANFLFGDTVEEA
ncbi:unnamed protein product [Clonostachys rosea]|uniref:NADP-dependent oxidoreductase domain-containing protein n=1 Tax=Bionectria ochroleuca TaxID=29856 RepID=A0ABY6U736_BIOOC|nr:unnamed protein product [Clonostachys rosea]